MFDFPSSSPTALHVFFARHGDAARNAGLLLGGQKWLGKVHELHDELRINTCLTERARKRALELYNLLTLEYVDDLSREESYHFWSLDPGGAYVTEICLLADALGAALRTIENPGLGEDA